MTSDYMCARIQHLKTRIFELEALLAQALKEKNELTERLNAKQVELDQLRDELTESKEAFDARNGCITQLRQMNDNQFVLIENVKRLHTETREREMHLALQVTKLSAELSALRPPEPKFKIAQVVADKTYPNRFFRIIEHREPTNGCVTYWGVALGTDASGRLWERDLRELTAAEKGEQS